MVCLMIPCRSDLHLDAFLIVISRRQLVLQKSAFLEKLLNNVAREEKNSRTSTKFGYLVCFCYFCIKSAIAEEPVIGIVVAGPDELSAVRSAFDREVSPSKEIKDFVCHYGLFGQHVVAVSALAQEKALTAAFVVATIRAVFKKLHAVIVLGVREVADEKETANVIVSTSITTPSATASAVQLSFASSSMLQKVIVLQSNEQMGETSAVLLAAKQIALKMHRTYPSVVTELSADPVIKRSATYSALTAPSKDKSIEFSSWDPYAEGLCVAECNSLIVHAVFRSVGKGDRQDMAERMKAAVIGAGFIKCLLADTR